MTLTVQKQPNILPCTPTKASSTIKNSLKMVVVIHTFPLVQYFTFLTQRGFKGFPNLTGTNKKTIDTTFNF